MNNKLAKAIEEGTVVAEGKMSKHDSKLWNVAFDLGYEEGYNKAKKEKNIQVTKRGKDE